MAIGETKVVHNEDVWEVHQQLVDNADGELTLIAEFSTEEDAAEYERRAGPS